MLKLRKATPHTIAPAMGAGVAQRRNAINWLCPITENMENPDGRGSTPQCVHSQGKDPESVGLARSERNVAAAV